MSFIAWNAMNATINMLQRLKVESLIDSKATCLLLKIGLIPQWLGTCQP